MSIKLEHNDWTWRNGHEPIPSVVLSASNLTSANGQYGARLFSAMGTLHLKQERSLNWVWHLRTVWISGRATNSSATTNYSLWFRQTGRWSDRGWLWRCRLQNDKAIWRERHSLMTFISWRWWMCYRGRWWSGEGTCGGPCCYRYQWWSRWETCWSPLWDVEGGGMAVRELGDSCQEDLVQPSCEMEGHLCAEEEQAGLGSSFVGFDWYRCQWGKNKSQQNPSLCLGSRSCLMRQVVAFIHIAPSGKILERCACMLVVCILLLQFTLDMIGYHCVTREREKRCVQQGQCCWPTKGLSLHYQPWVRCVWLT